MPTKAKSPFFAALKSRRHHFTSKEIVELFKYVDNKRVNELASRV